MVKKFDWNDFESEEVGQAQGAPQGQGQQFRWQDFESEEAPQQETTIGQDVLRSALGAPAALMSTAAALPGEALASGSEIIHHPIRAAGMLGAGALTGLKGLYNLPLHLGAYLGRKGVPGFGIAKKYAPKLMVGDTGLQQKVFGAPQSGDELLQAIGAFTPIGKIGALAEAAGGLKGASRLAAEGAAYAGGQGQDPLQAALLGAALPAALKGAKVGARALNFPAAYRRGLSSLSPLTPEQLGEAARVTEGTETALGDVLDNRGLSYVSDTILPNIPFSVALPRGKRVAKDMSERANKIFDKIKKPSFDEVNINEEIGKALNETKSNVISDSNENFKGMDSRAKKEGVSVKYNELTSYAKNRLAEIKEDRKRLEETPKEIIKKLEFYAGEGTDETSSFNGANILRGIHRAKARDATTVFEKKIHNALARAIEKDMDSAAETGSGELKSEYRRHNKFYRDNVVPFTSDQNLRKFTSGKFADTDTLLRTFLPIQSQVGRPKLLSSLLERLPQKERDLIPYAYFSKAIDSETGEINPLAFHTLNERIAKKDLNNPTIRDLLFKDKPIKQELKDYSNLARKNKEAMTSEFIPKTGYRDLMAAAAGYLAHGLSAGLAGAKGPLALIAGARGAEKLMTSPAFRESMIKRIAKAKEGSKKRVALEPSQANAFQKAMQMARAAAQPAPAQALRRGLNDPETAQALAQALLSAQNRRGQENGNR